MSDPSGPSDNLFVTDYRLFNLLGGKGYIPGKPAGAGGVVNYADLADSSSVDIAAVNVPLANDLNAKQDKLTAGTNITISGSNVISATGGGGGATSYEDLTDAESVDLPNKNTPLFNALGTLTTGKQNKLTAGANITISGSNVISASGGGGGGTGFPPLGIESSTGSLDTFRTKLTNSGSQRVVINVFGDSVSNNYYVSNWVQNSNGKNWWIQLMQQLQATYGDGGSGMRHILMPAGSGLSQSGQVLTGTWTLSSLKPYFGSGYNITSDPTATLTSYVRGKDVVILYAPSTAADPWTFTLNGASIGTFDFGSTFTTATDSMQLIQVFSNVGTGGDDTLVCSKNAGNTTTTRIIATGGFNATGVVVNGIGIPTQPLQKVESIAAVKLSTFWNNQWCLFDTRTTTVPHPCAPYMNPDLVILEQGLNDGSGQGLTSGSTPVDPDVYQQYLFHSMNSLKCWLPDTVFCNLFVCGYKDGTESGTDATPYYNSFYDAYKNRSIALCKSHGGIHVDVSARVCQGSFLKAITNSYYASTVHDGTAGTTVANSDGIHPGDVGHGLIATSLYYAFVTANI